MARSIQDDAAPPKAGHNKPPLTKEERNALLVHHIGHLRSAQQEIEKARGPFDAAREAFTDRINGAKADMGKAYTRKRLTGLLEDVGCRVRDLAREEEQRFHDRVALGLPVFGVQQDLFAGGGASMPQEDKDKFEWEADGYLAGRRVDARKPPEGTPPRMDQAWLTGYDRGQQEAAAQFTKGGEILAARDAPPAKPEEKPEPADEQKAIAKSARKLKEGGFLNVVPKGDEALVTA